MYTAASRFYQGASHRDAGRVCQDHASHFEGTVDGVEVTAVFVADGHGSAQHFRSDIGARLATEAAEEALPYIVDVLNRKLTREEPGLTVCRGVADEAALTDADRTPRDVRLEAAARMFFVRVNSLWASKVLAHYNANPLEENTLAGAARAYGCTLIGALRTPRWWFAFQLGDGLCVAYDQKGRFFAPIPADSRCTFQRTTSMCSHGARDFRYAYGTDVPPALMVCTDGIADCFDTPRALAECVLAPVMLDSLRRGFDATVADFDRNIPELSEKGSRDDVSLALWLEDYTCGEIAPEVRDEYISRAVVDLNRAYDELNDCNESIAEIEGSVSTIAGRDDAGDAGHDRLSRLKRRQAELLLQIDSINLDINNIQQ